MRRRPVDVFKFKKIRMPVAPSEDEFDFDKFSESIRRGKYKLPIICYKTIKEQKIGEIIGKISLLGTGNALNGEIYHELMNWYNLILKAIKIHNMVHKTNVKYKYDLKRDLVKRLRSDGTLYVSKQR